jgi:hypothetical protein
VKGCELKISRLRLHLCSKSKPKHAERYIKWHTPWLSREFEMLVFGNGGGLPLILFPTSFGSYYQNKDFGLVGSVSGYVDAGRLTVYCPSISAHFSTATTTITFISTVPMNICQTCPTHGNIVRWELSSAQANGITHATNPIACLRS